MNRLIIIGNGFDLAHGLPTSYGHFINDYWRGVISKLIYEKKYEDDLLSIDITFGMNDLWFKHDFEKTVKDYSSLFKILRNTDGKINFSFKNSFLEKISELNQVQNWVDIENVFYEELLKTLEKSPIPDFTWLGVESPKNKNIIDINNDFEKIKFLLEHYLHDKVETKYKLENNKSNPFLEYIKDCEKLTTGKLNQFYSELPFNLTIELNRQLLENPFPDKIQHPVLQITNYFLNFNYTDTLLKYFEVLNINENQINHLHGRLRVELNPLNFGFGDEMDKMYSKIEDKNDNEYLKNIKSFQYLNTPNYKNLMDFIDGEIFQVIIMGHSCGLSDRTLLNTIFEHNNCRSIKVFYHQKEDGSDDYTVIIQNISRHFNKKKLMREKIVNKTLCKPLPQIQLPKKQ